MIDHEKVIKGLECCAGQCNYHGCPYKDPCENANGVKQIMFDAIAIIKEQEAVMEWKDARHELPDKQGDYLVFIPGEYHDTMMVARYSFNRAIPWRGAQAHSAIEDVLLWMHLPKVPKEGR